MLLLISFLNHIKSYGWLACGCLRIDSHKTRARQALEEGRMSGSTRIITYATSQTQKKKNLPCNPLYIHPILRMCIQIIHIHKYTYLPYIENGPNIKRVRERITSVAVSNYDPTCACVWFSHPNPYDYIIVLILFFCTTSGLHDAAPFVASEEASFSPEPHQATVPEGALLQDVTLQHSTWGHVSQVRYTTLPYGMLRYVTLYYGTLHYTTPRLLHGTRKYGTQVRYATLRYTTVRCVTRHYTTLRYQKVRVCYDSINEMCAAQQQQRYRRASESRRIN
jgi:hypothetical protein